VYNVNWIVPPAWYIPQKWWGHVPPSSYGGAALVWGTLFRPLEIADRRDLHVCARNFNRAVRFS